MHAVTHTCSVTCDRGSYTCSYVDELKSMENIIGHNNYYKDFQLCQAYIYSYKLSSRSVAGC